jgi:hypothetical protein
MWDEMLTTFEIVQTNVEGSSMIRAPKKRKKELTIEEKREKTIDNLIMKKYPKGLDKIECKHVNESFRSEFLNYFPLGNKPVERVKVLVDKFLPSLRTIVYCPLSDTQEQNQALNFDVPLHRLTVSNFCYSC